MKKSGLTFVTTLARAANVTDSNHVPFCLQAAFDQLRRRSTGAWCSFGAHLAGRREPIWWDIYKRSVQRGGRGAAEQFKSANEIITQNLDRSRDTCAASGAKSVGISASDQHGPGTYA